MTGFHRLLPPGGPAGPLAFVRGGSLLVRVFVPGLEEDPGMASALLQAVSGGSLWLLIRRSERWPGTLEVPPDLLPVEGSPRRASFVLPPEEAFRRAALLIEGRLGRPLSPEEGSLVSSLPGVLRGLYPVLLVMLG